MFSPQLASRSCCRRVQGEKWFNVEPHTAREFRNAQIEAIFGKIDDDKNHEVNLKEVRGRHAPRPRLVASIAVPQRHASDVLFAVHCSTDSKRG
eukprot:5536718-Prymnesium_polylepis.2